MIADLQERWPDPVTFIEGELIDPETGELFKLYPEEKRFIRKSVRVGKDGRLAYPELLFSGPKKSGKSTLAAMLTLYFVVVLGGRFAEGYCVANDLEQAQGRVFQAAARIIEASPLFQGEATVTATKITFAATGATITAIAADYAGAAGSNPTIVSFDELWAVTSERGVRLFDEMVPPPTRKIAARLTTTYSGFEGESELLEGLYKRALKGKSVARDLWEQPGMLAYWSHEARAPWQTAAWLAQMRDQLRPNAYLRMIENRWVTSESSFVDPAWWQACINRDLRPVVRDSKLPVWAGLDASSKRDWTAIVAVTFDQEAKRVRLVWHRVFKPSATDPLDFEATIEDSLTELRGRFLVREVRYDPWQMMAVAQRLARAGVPMVEFPQSVPNLTAASSNLYELIKGRGIEVYPDDDMTLAINRAVAVETSRGWRITKEKTAHKIDVVVALAMAALGATKGGQQRQRNPNITFLTADSVPVPGVWLPAFGGLSR